MRLVLKQLLADTVFPRTLSTGILGTLFVSTLSMTSTCMQVKLIGLIALLFLSSGVANGQIYELPNPAESEGDYFGAAVAIDGSRALVGANGADMCGENSGAAFVYEFDDESGHWSHTAVLDPAECAEGMAFGRSVALDDSFAVVTSFRETPIANIPNSVFVFKLQEDGSWKRESNLRASFDGDEGAFASSVSIRDGRVAVSTTGDTASGRYSGAVYVFRRNANGRWSQEKRLSVDTGYSPGVFGGQAVLGQNFLAVTSPSYSKNGKGSILIFELESGEWELTRTFKGLDDFSLAVAAADSSIIVGEKSDGDDSSGSATIFVRGESGEWQRRQILKPVNPFELGAFGTAVAISSELAMVVGYDEQLRFEFNIDRVVYVFEFDAEKAYWRQRHIVDVGDVYFGTDLDIDGRVALIGKASDTTTGQAVIVHLH